MAEQAQMSVLGNKKRKRPSDVGQDGDGQSPRRPSLNGDDHLDPTTEYGAEDFAHHLQSATHAINETVNNGLATDTALPYGTNGDVPANSFEIVEHIHQGTPYNHSGVPGTYKPGDSGFASRGAKPAVGTAEWHQNRKDCHKEVERRRRENINEGIMALAEVVPECEKAKGAIVHRAVNYVHELRNHIAQLQQDNAQTKGTLEGLLAQMTATNTELRTENDSVLEANKRLKAKLVEAGIDPEDGN